MTSLGTYTVVALMAMTLACFHEPGTQAKPAATADIAELWQDPGNIASLDLFHGRGGPALAPSPATEYVFKALDTTGYSGGYDVVDPQGREWDVKIGVEARSELVASRILWAAGYRQPIMYFMPEWTMKGGPVPRPPPGRFRYGNENNSSGEWSWTENPFVGTREFQGLVIANLLLNNWDLKASNNRIYQMTPGHTPARWFVVQDLGASLGKTGWPVGNRNDVDGFERQRFVLGVDRGRVQFDYHARHRELLEQITPADVVWISRLFNRLSDRQWSDAFRAAAYPPETADRYIRAIKSKIQEGLALESS